jgi:hypothetical protein
MRTGNRRSATVIISRGLPGTDVPHSFFRTISLAVSDVQRLGPSPEPGLDSDS